MEEDRVRGLLARVATLREALEAWNLGEDADEAEITDDKDPGEPVALLGGFSGN